MRLKAAHFKGTDHIQVTYYNHCQEKGKKSDLTFTEALSSESGASSYLFEKTFPRK